MAVSSQVRISLDCMRMQLLLTAARSTTIWVQHSQPAELFCSKTCLWRMRSATHLDVDHLPAKGLVAGRHILSEGDLRVAVNGDLVVVVEGDQLAQAPVTSQGGNLVRDTLWRECGRQVRWMARGS